MREKGQKKRRKEKTRRAQTFSAHRTRCSWLLSALCTLPAGMALPAVPGSLESHFQEQQHASWPARAPAALGFTMEYFFMERSGGCERPLWHQPLPPPAFPTESLEQDPVPGAYRALTWPQSEPLTQSQFEPCMHWLRESLYWSVPCSKLELALTPKSTLPLFVVQTHLGVNPFTRV